MGELFQKIKNLFVYPGNEDDEFDEDEYYDDYPEQEAAPQISVVGSKKGQRAFVPQQREAAAAAAKTGIPTGKLVVYRPIDMDDARDIIDSLVRYKRPLIINLDGLEKATAQRIIDCVYGACHAIGGGIYKISGRIFAVAPANCPVVGAQD